jgi:hypothetical protein
MEVKSMKFTNKQATTALSLALLLSVPAAQAGWMDDVNAFINKVTGDTPAVTAVATDQSPEAAAAAVSTDESTSTSSSSTTPVVEATEEVKAEAVQPKTSRINLGSLSATADKAISYIALPSRIATAGATLYSFGGKAWDVTKSGANVVATGATHVIAGIPTKEVAKEAVSRFVSENKKPLLIGGAVVGTGVAGYLAYKKLSTPKAVEANRAVEAINLDLSNSQLKKQAKTLDDVINNVEGTIAKDKWPKVTHIMLQNNGLTEINEALITFLQKFPNLHTVWFCYNNITELPSNLADALPNVQEFHFFGTALTNISADITAKIRQ